MSQGLIDAELDVDSLLRERYEEYYAATPGRLDPFLKLAELFFVHCKSVNVDAVLAHSLYLTHLAAAGSKLARELERDLLENAQSSA